MGSYYRYYIDVNTNDEELINFIRHEGRLIEKEEGTASIKNTWDSCYFRKWSSSSISDAKRFVVKLSLRPGLEGVIFSVNWIKISASGEDRGSGKYFVRDGFMMKERQLFPVPSFPSVGEWNKRKRYVTKQVADEKQKDVIEKKKRIAEITEELERLKASLNET